MKLLEIVEQLFAHYGYLVLIIGLPLDAIALPIPPGNTTLTYTGYLSYKGVLDWLPAMASAYAGAVIGITITYWAGYKLGMPLIERYGKWLFLKPEKVKKTGESYRKYGDKLLLISFFLPGVRQFIGYFSGIIRIPFRTFALYAYTGAGLWVVGFFGIGYVFGAQWQRVLALVERDLKYVLIALCGALLTVLLLKWRKRWKTGMDKPDGGTGG